MNKGSDLNSRLVRQKKPIIKWKGIGTQVGGAMYDLVPSKLYPRTYAAIGGAKLG